MGKYASWAELEAAVPAVYEEKATAAAFLAGLEKITPPGMRPKEERGRNYELGTRGKGRAVVAGIRRAMFR